MKINKILKVNIDDLKIKDWVKSISNKLKIDVDNINQKYISNQLKLITNNFNLDYVNPKKFLEYLQDKIEEKFKDDNNRVILRQSRIWANSITWVLISGSVFGIGWLAVAKTEEIAISVGKLEPKGGVIDVQMPIEGVAREILIKDGDFVKKGQVLINLDTEITEAQNSALLTTLNLNNSMKEKLSLLVKEGAVSEYKYMELLEKIEDIKSRVKTNSVKLKYQQIISPVDGVVFELQPKGAGYVAQTSQPVLKIVPTNNLIAKVEIDSRLIGFIDVGKFAEISIDSFPARDFGALKGTVTSIGSDALPPSPAEGKGYRFPAVISLENQYLKLKNGKKLALQAGMSLSANIKLRKVTYLQLLLNKFGDKTESLKSM